MKNFIFLLSETGLGIGAADQFFGMLRFFVATIFVAVLAYYATKKLGSRGIGRKGGNISLIETINVGGQAVVQLIKAGEKYFVIGVTREQVTLLAEVDKEQITEPEPVDFSNSGTAFGKILSKYIQPKEKDGEDDE